MRLEKWPTSNHMIRQSFIFSQCQCISSRKIFWLALLGSHDPVLALPLLEDDGSSIQVEIPSWHHMEEMSYHPYPSSAAQIPDPQNTEHWNSCCLKPLSCGMAMHQQKTHPLSCSTWENWSPELGRPARRWLLNGSKYALSHYHWVQSISLRGLKPKLYELLFCRLVHAIRVQSSYFPCKVSQHLSFLRATGYHVSNLEFLWPFINLLTELHKWRLAEKF